MVDGHDIDIVKEEAIDVMATRQRVAFAKYTYFIAAALLVPWAILAMVVLFDSYAKGREGPNWAVALETAIITCLLYTSPSPRDRTRSRMPSSA